MKDHLNVYIRKHEQRVKYEISWVLKGRSSIKMERRIVCLLHTHVKLHTSRRLAIFDVELLRTKIDISFSLTV